MLLGVCGYLFKKIEKSKVNQIVNHQQLTVPPDDRKKAVQFLSNVSLVCCEGMEKDQDLVFLKEYLKKVG